MKRILIILTTIFFIGCSKEDTPPTMYTLNVTSNPTEGGTINPTSGEYEEGTEVTLRVNTNTNYEFDKWSGSWSGSESPLTLIMDSDKNIVGNFKLMDSDGDGVTDDLDSCTDTPSGQNVDSNGCSDSQKDTDGDGVNDDVDTCSDTPSGETVDSNGCSDSQKDTDGDGVSDDVDTCSNTPSGESVDENGCSDSQKDTDGDGVNDDVDTCSDTPSGETVDSNGCSDSQKDTDGDGVSDDVDTCSNTPSGESVDENGCSDSQKDTDGDGVSDDVDECNNTVNGRPVNSNGCQNPIYLDENGVTVKSYDWGNLGDVGVIDGVEYLIVDKPTLRQMILNGQDVSKVCTTFLLDLNSLFDLLVNQGPNNSNIVNFNQDISSWDVSNVTSMRYTFWYSTFNQDISSWDVSNVKNMKYMFYESKNFNQDLSTWNVDKVHGCEGFSFHNRGNNVWTLPKPNFTSCNPD